MELVLVLAVTVLLAAFVQGATGFGFGLLSMSVLPLLLDVTEAVPLVSGLALVLCLGVLARWWRHVDLRQAGPLLIGEVVGTPLGVFFLTRVDRRVVTAALGVVLLAYGASHLLTERRPARASGEAVRLPSRGWGALAGFVGGILGGAFNTGGPPVILYATARRWKPAAFRANLQVVFLFNTVFQMALFARNGLLTPRTLELDLIALPALLLGLGLGTLLATRLDAGRFRRLVLGLLVLFGVVFLVRSL